jgi:hypothetical protein
MTRKRASESGEGGEAATGGVVADSDAGAAAAAGGRRVKARRGVPPATCPEDVSAEPPTGGSSSSSLPCAEAAAAGGKTGSRGTEAEPWRNYGVQQWRHLNAMSNAVHCMRAAEIKEVMALIRTEYLAGPQRAKDVVSAYFPRYGLTAGEFATLYVLNMPGKPSKKRSALQQRALQ